ncbi:hypothetical protein JL722_7689 [Aureococcus anophagefferens]|nr:hypothetical protein JL722_7689 [Aureococcus anophagefferens]
MRDGRHRHTGVLYFVVIGINLHACAHGGALDGGALDGGAFDGGAFDGGAFDDHAFDDHAFDDHAFDDHAFDGGAVDVPADDVGTDSESDETVVDAVPDARAVAAAGKSHRKSSDREPERRTDGDVLRGARRARRRRRAAAALERGLYDDGRRARRVL